MSEFPFPQLWAQVRRKSWMWLFRRPQVEAATKMLRHHVQIQAAILVGPRELELKGQSGRSDMTHDEPRLSLKLNDAGDLHITTDCTCHSGSLCEHAAAIMLLCEQAATQQIIQRIARPGRSGLGAEAPGGTATAAENVTHLSNDDPRPGLKLRRLSVLKEQLKMNRSAVGNVPISIGVIEPWAEYAGCPKRFPMLARQTAHTWTSEDKQQMSLTRNLRMERLFLADLMQTGMQNFAQALPEWKADEATHTLMTVPMQGQAIHWAQFVRDIVPQLKSEGWQIEIADNFGFTIHEAEDEAWFTDLQADQSGKDWFALDLGIDLGGQRISLVPLLVDCIDQGLTPAMLEENPDEKLLLGLPGEGSPVLAVPAKRLLGLLRFLDELLATRPARKDGKLQIDKLRAAQLSTLDGLPIQAPVELAALQQRLLHFKEIALVQPPEGLKAELRPYQREGLSWLQFLREFSLHGVLADDMGLGKTMQTLSHLLLEKESGRADRPSLILAPTSVIRNWGREAAKFTPALRVMLLHGDDRRSDFRWIGRYDLIITSYPLLVRDADELQKIDWHIIALDEAQNIKNPKSKAAQVAGSLKGRHRLCLTGTPMENHLGELWSLYQFLMPGLLGDADSFRSYYRNPIEKDRDAGKQMELSKRLQPLLLRRTKDAVAKDLPPKTEILQTIELGKAQTDLYETIRAVMDERVREAISAQGLDRSQIVVLDALLKLRQVCCHPNLLKQETARSVTESAKTSFLMEELLPELLEEGRKVLIFSQFTEMLAIIESHLKAASIPFVKLTGDTKDRETPILRFQKGEVPLFLISLKAGGAGLNLTAADTVIHYDPWWNPAAEAQASDRAHRIGQTKPVFVHKLICQGTIEERIVEMQKSKSALIEGLLTGRTDTLRMTQEDIQRLLQA